MPSIDIINKRLQDFLSIKAKVKDINCITENLYDRAKNISNSFSNASSLLTFDRIKFEKLSFINLNEWS